MLLVLKCSHDHFFVLVGGQFRKQKYKMDSYYHREVFALLLHKYMVVLTNKFLPQIVSCFEQLLWQETHSSLRLQMSEKALCRLPSNTFASCETKHKRIKFHLNWSQCKILIDL